MPPVPFPGQSEMLWGLEYVSVAAVHSRMTGCATPRRHISVPYLPIILPLVIVSPHLLQCPLSLGMANPRVSSGAKGWMVGQALNHHLFSVLREL